VWDRERVVIIPDHYIFTADQRANRNVDILREFVQEQNIKCVGRANDPEGWMDGPPAQA